MILFVWDFHGTLEKNNVMAVQEIVNKTLKDFDIHRELTLDEAICLYGLSWVDYYKYVHPSGNMELWNKMRERGIEIQQTNKIVEKYIQPMDHAAEVLRQIRVKGHQNLLMSNTAPQWIRFFTRLVNIDEYFNDYLALEAHGEPREQTEINQLKSEALGDYIKGKSFEKIVKIGDRESDIQAGISVGAVTYFFKNMFNESHHLNTKPDYEISDLRKVLREI